MSRHDRMMIVLSHVEIRLLYSLINEKTVFGRRKDTKNKMAAACNVQEMFRTFINPIYISECMFYICGHDDEASAFCKNCPFIPWYSLGGNRVYLIQQPLCCQHNNISHSSRRRTHTHTHHTLEHHSGETKVARMLEMQLYHDLSMEFLSHFVDA